MLLTTTEVVERFRAARIGKDDKSRRSYVSQLIGEGKLLVKPGLPEGRSRAGKHDRRIIKGSLDNFLATGRHAHGPDATRILLAQLNQQREENALLRERVAKALREASAEIHAQDLQIADLKNQLRLQDTDLSEARGLLDDERGIRIALDEAILQILPLERPHDDSGDS